MLQKEDNEEVINLEGNLTDFKQGDHKPYRTLQPYQKTLFFLLKTLQSLTTQVFFYNNLTVGVLWNFTHKEGENASFFKKSSPAVSKQSLEIDFYVYTPKIFFVRPSTRS